MQDASSAFPGRRTHPVLTDHSEDMQVEYTPLPRCMCSFRYYFIDFGISKRFEGPGPHLVTGTIGRDPSAPEMSDTVPYDPFKLDIYYLGNHFLQEYVRVCSFLYMRPVTVLDHNRNNRISHSSNLSSFK